MRIILLITVLESLAITSWILLRRFKNEYSNLPAAREMIPFFNSATAKSSITASRNPSRWSFINAWKVEDQADDRMLTLGTVAERAGSAAARRSFARRSHQRSFKAWSQERHD